MPSTAGSPSRERLGAERHHLDRLQAAQAGGRVEDHRLGRRQVAWPAGSPRAAPPPPPGCRPAPSKRWPSAGASPRQPSARPGAGHRVAGASPLPSRSVTAPRQAPGTSLRASARVASSTSESLVALLSRSRAWKNPSHSSRELRMPPMSRSEATARMTSPASASSTRSSSSVKGRASSRSASSTPRSWPPRRSRSGTASSAPGRRAVDVVAGRPHVLAVEPHRGAGP